MARIIPFSGDPHEQVQALLPWYLNGTLDDAEAANVDAHLAECPRCRAEVEAEKALRREVAGAGIDPDRGWQQIRANIGAGDRKVTEPQRGLLSRKVALGWALGVQFAVAGVLLGVSSIPRPDAEPEFRALGASNVAPAANAIILFRPDADIAEVRAALTTAGARITGGPTSSGAYLLNMAADKRAAALASLRGRASVVLAEPIDGDMPR